MTAPAPPASPPARPPISATGTLAEAWRLMIRYPRATMFPMFVVEFPLAVLTAVASAVLYLTVFQDEAYPRGGLLGIDEAGIQAFAAVVVAAVNLLFALVGQAATVVAVAGAFDGRPRSLSSSLDPAFTRMGALLVLALILAAIVLGLVASVVGLVVLPYVALRLGLAFNVMILEGLSPTRAIRRSWGILKGRMLRFAAVIGLTFLVVLPLLVLRSIPVLPGDAGRNVRIAVDSAAALVEGVLIVPIAVLATAVTTVFYLKLRAQNDARTAA